MSTVDEHRDGTVPGGAQQQAGVVSGAADDADLVVQRDRLTERFVLAQSELGGLFYEMAIRDHLQLDLLVQRAAAMQQLESELRVIEGQIAASGQGRE